MRLLLALLLLLASCTPDDIAEVEDAILNPPQGTVHPTETVPPTVEPAPTQHVVRGVVLDRTLVRVDRQGKLRAVFDGRDYFVRFEESKGQGPRVWLEAVTEPAQAGR